MRFAIARRCNVLRRCGEDFDAVLSHESMERRECVIVFWKS
jgi:hypothetical protein